MTTGDSLSVRTKFCFLTWIGEKGGPLAKARAGPNKRVLQQVITVSQIIDSHHYFWCALKEQTLVSVSLLQVFSSKICCQVWPLLIRRLLFQELCMGGHLLRFARAWLEVNRARGAPRRWCQLRRAGLRSGSKRNAHWHDTTLNKNQQHSHLPLYFASSFK